MQKVFIYNIHGFEMIFITGDVHSKNMGGWEQEKMGSEVKASIKYLDILKKNKLKSTLFINGICLDQEKQDIDELLKYDAELGGHTYNNFDGLDIFRGFIYRKIWKCIYGPKYYQKKDIKKTKQAFNRVGLKMTSWRTHAFGSNDYTFEVLKQSGVTHVSDLLGEQIPFEKNGIIHMPLNIPVDQNTIAYGFFAPENRDSFASCTKGRISPEEWFDILKKRVEKNEKEKKDSIILIHPATMAALDNFALFEKVAKFLSKYKSEKISNFNP